MVYTTRKYLKELKTNPYWEVEPHFYYYCLLRTLRWFETALKNKLSPKELKSALYGEFVIEGKPMLDGFIQNLNLTLRFLNNVIKKVKLGSR